MIDVLHRSHLYEVIGEENIFATDVRAIAALYAPAHREGAEPDCPFLGVVPRLAELSLHPDGSLRDASRHRLPRCRHIAALRIESPINRGSVRYVEEWVLERIADRPDLRHVLLVANGMTDLDEEGAHRLAGLVSSLRGQGLGVSFSGVPETVLDTLERSGAMEAIGHGSLYPTQAMAVASVWGSAHVGSEETACPLQPLTPHLTELALHPQGTLRDASRHGLHLCRQVAVLRFDGPSSFVSAAAMTTEFDRWQLERGSVGSVVFMGSALAGLDARQAGNMLELVRHVRARSTRVVICSLPDHVFEVLARTGVADAIGVEDIYPSENGALAAVWGPAHEGSDEDPCPLKPLLPHVTELSLHPDGSLRDARRHGLARCRHIAVVRFDGRLDYSTVASFERGIVEVVDGRAGIGFLLIAGHTLDHIDAIAAEELVGLLDRLRRRGLQVCVSGLRDEVLDALVETGVHRAIGEECLFPTQARALERIFSEAHQGSTEVRCPLRDVVARDDGASAAPAPASGRG